MQNEITTTILRTQPLPQTNRLKPKPRRAPCLKPFRISGCDGLEAVLNASFFYGDSPHTCLLELPSTNVYRCLGCNQLVVWVQIGRKPAELFDAESHDLRQWAYVDRQAWLPRYFARLLRQHRCSGPEVRQ